MPGPKPKPVIDRLLAKLQLEGSCWIFTGADDGYGYGHFWVSEGVYAKAHRWLYEFLVGPVPEGLVLDHLCRRTKCCNPDHLEPVTQKENVRRSYSRSMMSVRTGRCLNGHEMTPENTYTRTRKSGPQVGQVSRSCKTCTRVQQTKARQLRRQE
jgi:hypothetical protein